MPKKALLFIELIFTKKVNNKGPTINQKVKTALNRPAKPILPNEKTSLTTKQQNNKIA